MPPQHVLVCAEPSTAERVAEVLRSRGYASDTASDGERAVELAQQTHPGVVLTWSDLPGPEAADLIRRVRRGSSTMRVAAVLRSTDADQASALLEEGADAVVLDGGDLEFLAWTVDRLVEGGLVVDPALARSLVAPPGAHVGGEGDEVRAVAEGYLHDELVLDRDLLGPDQVDPFLAAEEHEPGVDFRECDVAEIVHEGAAEAARGYPSVLVQVSAPPKLTAVAEADALRGVVRILVDNACRDSESGSDVTVKAQRVDAGITVLVTDRGPGLDREQVAAAFGAAEEPAGEGPASGLNLARSLVALHGGILWAEPLPAGGNRVSFTIPEKPPALTSVELQEAIHALELLERIETSPEPVPSSGEEADAEDPDGDSQLLDEALDLAAALADAAALAQTPPLEPEEPAGAAAQPVASLADLFDLEPEVAALADVGAAEGSEPEADDDLAMSMEAEADDDLAMPVEPEAPSDADVIATAEPVTLPDPEPPETEPVAVPDIETADDWSLPDDVPGEEVSEGSPVPLPEPVPAANAVPDVPERPAHSRVTPVKSFVPDPLHPATAILRGLAEDYDAYGDGVPGLKRVRRPPPR